MNNFWKKTAAGIMALLIVAAASPIQPIAQFAKTAVMTAYAEDVTATLNDDGVLTLSGEVSKAQVAAVDKDAVTKIVAAAGTKLPVNCTDLFKGFTNVTSIDLSEADTSNVTIMPAMFDGCSALTSVDLSGFDTSNVTVMTCMFQGCSSLTSLDLSSFDISKLENISAMFKGCSALTEIITDGWDIDSVNSHYDVYTE